MGLVNDACGNETCWDLYEAEGCQKSPELKLAILTKQESSPSREEEVSEMPFEVPYLENKVSPELQKYLDYLDELRAFLIKSSNP